MNAILPRASDGGRFKRGPLQLAHRSFRGRDLFCGPGLDLDADQRRPLERHDVDFTVSGTRTVVAGHNLVTEPLKITVRQILGARS